uniref:Variant surface glycoprotein 1125.510 n=1 Tax=Trypanosoma brucei TaxID=5691 RepID=A0A1J0R622_9TRYP|nr:variant surface glycoprotein 1125.510 [Trypanosoma brucei]
MTRFLLLIFLIQPDLSDAKTKNCASADHDVTYIGEVAKTLQSKFDKGVSGEETTLKLKLFAAATPHKTQASAAIAAAKAITRFTRAAEQALRGDRKTETRMLADLPFHFGRDSSLSVVKTAVIAAIAQSSASGSAVHKGITLAAHTSGLTKEKCTPGEYATETATIAKASEHHKQQLVFQQLTSKEASNDNSGGSAKACITSNDCTSTSQGTNLAVQAGPLYKTAPIKDPAKGASKANKEDLIIYVSDVQQAAHLAKLDSDIAGAVAETKQYAANCMPWDRLADMELLKDVTAIGSGGKRPATIGTGSIAAAKTALKDLFGSQESEWKEKLWNAVEEQEVSTGQDGNQAKAKISTISGLTALDAALTATHIQKLLTATDTSLPKDTAKQTKTDKPEEPKKTADECKKHTTEQPCKEGGCDFDEKKPEGEKCFSKTETDKKDENSFSCRLRASILQVFAALISVVF